jgi:hypothetical protein
LKKKIPIKKGLKRKQIEIKNIKTKSNIKENKLKY